MIARVDQHCAVAEHLGQRARPCRHHGHTGPHGLQRREPEALVEGGEGQHAGPREQAPPGRSPPPSPYGRSCLAHLRPSMADASACSPHPGGPARTRATSACCLGHRTEGQHQARQVLPGLRRPDGQAEAPEARRQQPPQHRRRVRLGRDGQIGDAGIDDADAGRIGIECLHHLAGHERGVGVDPGAAIEGAPDQPRVGERRRIAQFGMVQRREVVHRDHGGGPTGRGHQEVRPVHDVGGADEPLQRREVPPGPQCVKGTGRHGSLPRRDARRELRLHQPAAAPAHGIGPHVDARALRQGRQCAVAERPDARGQPEQRRCIERDAQARRCRRPGTCRTCSGRDRPVDGEDRPSDVVRLARTEVGERSGDLVRVGEADR